MSKDLYLHLNIYIYKNYVFQEYVHKNGFTEESLCYLKYTYFVDQLLVAQNLYYDEYTLAIKGL